MCARVISEYFPGQRVVHDEVSLRGIERRGLLCRRVAGDEDSKESPLVDGRPHSELRVQINFLLEEKVQGEV